MSERKLEKAEWHPFFERVSKTITGKRAEIEVAALGIGDQVEAEWLPLNGIVYDPKDDALEVMLEGHEHLIRRPREIYVEEGIAGLKTIVVAGTGGTRQFVRLRDPLMLPGPAAAA